MNLNDDFDPARPNAPAPDDDGPNLPPLSAEEEARVKAALAALGPAESARPEFRASLRARFVDGSLAAPVEAPSASPARVPVAARRPRVFRPWAAALAATALLAIAVFAWLPWPGLAPAPAPVWTVIAMTPDSTVAPGATALVDGRAVALTALTSATLAEGARVELPAGVALALRFGDTFVLETAPGTAFTLPTAGPARAASVAHGEVRCATGPGFTTGARLAVESPEARVEVTGTAFVVIAAPEMTCVCVGEGSVRVVARADTSGAPLATDIPAGLRREIYPDGTMSEALPVHAHEAARLVEMKAAMGAATKPR